MEEDEKKNGDYSLNTLEDIWKYDPLRLLDLGNVAQVLLSQNNPKVNEEARATSNFEKLVEGKRRPISHTLVDATRILPDIIAFAGPYAIKGVGKGIGKGMSNAITKNTTKGVAKKMVSEGTSDSAKAFARSKFLPRDEKVMAGKKWVRDLLGDTDAMERIAGRKLSDKEVAAVRKNINELVPHKIDKYNLDVDKLKDVYKKLNIKEKFETKEDLAKYLMKNKKSLGLTDVEYKNLLNNVDNLTNYNVKISHSHLPADRVIEEGKKVIAPGNVIEFIKPGKGNAFALGSVSTLKLGDAATNKYLKTKFQTKSPEMKPNYWTKGSKPTPNADFVAGIFGVDFNDPARFNEKDVETFFNFLDEDSLIEPGIKDKWTPRQKISVMREMLADEDYGPFVRERWAKYKDMNNVEKGE